MKSLFSAVMSIYVLKVAAAPWALRLVDPASGGLCLDGTPSGFWIRNGSGADARNYIIHLQGGGWCTSLSDCLARSKSTLGSSSQWPSQPQYASADGGEHGMISPDPSVNSLFANWTIVFAG